MREINKLKILIMIIALIALIYVFGGNKNSSKTTSDNYGQYDKGTAMCDKGAYGEVNGLCK
jgi:hypothetical protein